MSGFTQKNRALIYERDGGCIRCDTTEALQIHHRAPRQMGGSRAHWVNAPSNGITLCVDCHLWVESNRAEAEQAGWIVRRGIVLPALIPVLYRGEERWLTDNGGTADVGSAVPF